MSKQKNWRICLYAYNEGGHDNTNIETDACFTEEQADAIASLIEFLKDNNDASYFNAITEKQTND